ncbi:MAG TPA: hypothetical protein VGP82_20575 [Ktedonobacterales bacterium]|nr:hypothetical protein [Ktedonobacterales bacterium]
MYDELLAARPAQSATDGTVPSTYALTARFKGCGGERVPATSVQPLAERLSTTLKQPLATDVHLPLLRPGRGQ